MISFGPPDHFTYARTTGQRDPSLTAVNWTPAKVAVAGSSLTPTGTYPILSHAEKYDLCPRESSNSPCVLPSNHLACGHKRDHGDDDTVDPSQSRWPPR